MNCETFSLIVQCWQDKQQDIMRLRVVNVETAEEVFLSKSSFLLYCWIENGVERCLIRHLPSGREAYVQSGPGLQACIKTCLALT